PIYPKNRRLIFTQKICLHYLLPFFSSVELTLTWILASWCKGNLELSRCAAFQNLLSKQILGLTTAEVRIGQVITF
ncbi:MAG: hypothetical protein V7K53_25820, partial [Nostoc sp.]